MSELSEFTEMKKNQHVTVEGGYGHFQITQDDEQVWVGAGIGIVPFISRLHWLKQHADSVGQGKRIHLYYCVPSRKEAHFEQEILCLINDINQHSHDVSLTIMDAEERRKKISRKGGMT